MTARHPEYAELVQITETIELPKEQYKAICKYPLRDYDFLTGKGGYDDGWRTVVELTCKGKQTLYTDPSGSSYCRYLGIKVGE
jgi:hypothetical protein